ncbi:hypothetical protein FRC10_000781, partial [Ceratobasidium sp. 414]
MFDVETLKASREKARKAKKGIARYLPGSYRMCDCTLCYGNGIERPVATIETHWRRHHRHPDSLRTANPPCAGLPPYASLSQPALPQNPLAPPDVEMDNQPLDLDEEHMIALTSLDFDVG